MISWMRRTADRFRCCFSSAKLDRELDEEMSAHLELSIAEH